MSNDANTLLEVMQVNTFTVADMHRRLGLLRECVEMALFTESKNTFLEVCTENIVQEGNTEDAQAVIDWGASTLTAFTRDSLGSDMSKLHTAIDNLPVVTLYIPMEFPSEDVSGLGKWCRAQCDSKILMDIQIDPGVVGGCAFVWNDVYHDFSFTSRVKGTVDMVTNTLSSYAE